MKIVIIPARMDSKRFPGKPLHVIAGKPLLQWTYEAARRSIADRVYVATGDNAIRNFCIEHNMNVVGTGKHHLTGTHRCADALRTLESTGLEIERVVNLQVDEPLVEIEDLDELLENGALGLAVDTLIVHNVSNESFTRAIYSEIEQRCFWFSRASLSPWQHLGVYAYSAQVLKMLGDLPETYYSKGQSLEQLAWIEYGFQIFAEEASLSLGLPISVNTPEDAKRLEMMLC